MQILDGAGSGKRAKITVNNRLAVASSSTDAELLQTLDGDSFSIINDLLTFTSATAAGILYIKNNEAMDIVIQRITVALGTSTGGTNMPLLEVLRNPSAGTLISGATATSLINRNFGSTKTIDMTAYKGTVSSTISGGESLKINLPLAPNRHVLEPNWVLPRGASMAIKYTPPASNSSQEVSINLVIYKTDLEL